ncbi:MAG: hypothetical protein IKJ19_06660 [Clostridia bacterium]|nr:hypothetical protein [Clostridia bacterium]
MFGNKEKKEMEKRLLVKRTIASMNKQIEKLEQQKKFFLDKAVEARKKGLDSQLVTAMNGYKTTAMHLKRTQEMLLNFELTSQMKDMTMMTSEFLRSMGSLSKEMGKLADDKEFVKVQKEFMRAMDKVEVQTEQMDTFMEMSKDSFTSAAGVTASASSNAELEKLIDDTIVAETESPASAEMDDIEALKKKIDSMI